MVVKDPERKRRLGELYAERWNFASKMYRATLADLPPEVRQSQERMLAAADHLGTHFGESPVIAIFCFNPKELAVTDANLERVSVVGGGSIYTAVENLLLACRAEGLGCVLTTILCMVEAQVKELLSIPDQWGTAAAVPIGYPIRRGHGPITRRSIDELTYVDSWGRRP